MTKRSTIGKIRYYEEERKEAIAFGNNILRNMSNNATFILKKKCISRGSEV